MKNWNYKKRTKKKTRKKNFSINSFLGSRSIKIVSMYSDLISQRKKYQGLNSPITYAPIKWGCLMLATFICTLEDKLSGCPSIHIIQAHVYMYREICRNESVCKQYNPLCRYRCISVGRMLEVGGCSHNWRIS